MERLFRKLELYARQNPSSFPDSGFRCFTDDGELCLSPFPRARQPSCSRSRTTFQIFIKNGYVTITICNCCCDFKYTSFQATCTRTLFSFIPFYNNNNNTNVFLSTRVLSLPFMRPPTRTYVQVNKKDNIQAVAGRQMYRSKRIVRTKCPY